MPNRNLVFRVTSPSGQWPSGREKPPYLAHFFPAGHGCIEVNYGQGEGQILIDGREWGFYAADDRTLRVVLHQGDLPLDEATEIVAAICQRLRDELGEEFFYEFLARDSPLYD